MNCYNEVQDKLMFAGLRFLSQFMLIYVPRSWSADIKNVQYCLLVLCQMRELLNTYYPIEIYAGRTAEEKLHLMVKW